MSYHKHSNINSSGTNNDGVDRCKKSDNDDDDMVYEKDTSDLPTLQISIYLRGKTKRSEEVATLTTWLLFPVVDKTIEEHCRHGGIARLQFQDNGLAGILVSALL